MQGNRCSLNRAVNSNWFCKQIQIFGPLATVINPVTSCFRRIETGFEKFKKSVYKMYPGTIKSKELTQYRIEMYVHYLFYCKYRCTVKEEVDKINVDYLQWNVSIWICLLFVSSWSLHFSCQLLTILYQINC